jgi:hypothetical protein
MLYANYIYKPLALWFSLFKQEPGLNRLMLLTLESTVSTPLVHSFSVMSLNKVESEIVPELGKAELSTILCTLDF